MVFANSQDAISYSLSLTSQLLFSIVTYYDAINLIGVFGFNTDKFYYCNFMKVSSDWNSTTNNCTDLTATEYSGKYVRFFDFKITSLYSGVILFKVYDSLQA